MNANDNVVKDQRTKAVGLHLNDLLIRNAELCRNVGSEVDMTLCSDDALGELNLACGANELARAATCDVAALADRSLDADASCVGQRNLDLRSATLRTENACVESSLLANDRNLLGAGELAGLAG